MKEKGIKYDNENKSFKLNILKEATHGLAIGEAQVKKFS